MNPGESVTLLFTLVLGAWILGSTVRLYLRTKPVRFNDPTPPPSTPISETPFRILTVGGLGGEILALRWVGRYMLALKPALLTLFPNSRVRNHQPGVRLTSRQAAEDLACEILESEFQDAGAPLILIGHAKGGIDLLELMIQHPALIGRIRLAVIMNTPLGGSWVADLLVKRIFRPLNLKWTALEELTTEFRERFWKERWSALPEWHRRLILKRLHVVTSEEFHSTQCAWPIIFSHRCMRQLGLRSDGMITLESQRFPSTSPITTHFFWHHGFLTCRAMLSNITDIERQETLRAIFAQHLAVLRETKPDAGSRPPRHKMAHLASRRRYGHLEVIK